MARNRSEYVSGNNARQLRPKEQHNPGERVRKNQRRRRNREKALQMNPLYFFALAVAATVTLVLCIQYLQVQSSITARQHSITTKEKALEELKIANDAKESSINTYIDLDYIYQVATNELGMIPVNRNNVIVYDRTESEYVRQNDDIPQ